MLSVKPCQASGLTYSPGLQVLRGLAALMIVFLHLGVAEARYGSHGWHFLEGFRVGAAGSTRLGKQLTAWQARLSEFIPAGSGLRTSCALRCRDAGI